MWPAMAVFLLGSIGFIPPLPESLHLTPTEMRQEPSFKGRYITTDAVAKGIGYGGEHVTGGQRWIYIVPPSDYWLKHPEYYALRDGQRVFHQVCNSNPFVIDKFARDAIAYALTDPGGVFPMSPNDNGDFCECPSCLASRKGGNITDQVIAFYNAVLARGRELERTNNGHMPVAVGLLAYAQCARPPLKVKPDPSIIPTICRIGPFGHQISADSLRNEIRGWKALCPEVAIQELIGHYKWFGFLPLAPILKRDIDIYKEEGIEIVQSECHPHWATQGRELWIAQMLLWNSNWSLDELNQRWCKALYGNGWESAMKFFNLLDLQAGLFHSEDPSKWAPIILSSRKLARLRLALEEAQREAGEDERAQFQLGLLATGLEFSHAWSMAVVWWNLASKNDWSDGASVRACQHWVQKAFNISKEAPQFAFCRNITDAKFKRMLDNISK